jgi:hypothetical protein
MDDFLESTGVELPSEVFHLLGFLTVLSDSRFRLKVANQSNRIVSFDHNGFGPVPLWLTLGGSFPLTIQFE